MEQQNYMQFNSSHSHQPDQAILQCYKRQSKLSRLLPIWLNRFVQVFCLFTIISKDHAQQSINRTSSKSDMMRLLKYQDRPFLIILEIFIMSNVLNYFKPFGSNLKVFNNQYFLYDWTILFLFKLGMFITLVTNPMVTNLIIQLFDQKSNVPLYLETIAILILWVLCFMFFMSASSFYEKMLKAKLKTSLSFYLFDSLFKKAYPLPPIGELTTLLQLDITQITQILSSAATLVIIPFQLVGSIWVYYSLVGEAAIVGIVVTLINLFLCLLYGNIYSKYQQRIMQSRDQRVKGIEELLNGIQTIKQNGYYDLFTNRIKNKRENEMSDIKKQNYLLATITFIFSLLPIVVLFLTFSIYNNFSLKLILLVQQSYFQVSLVVNTIPGTLGEVLLAVTSMKRFTKYMNFRSMNILKIQNQEQTSQIVIQNGHFKWNAQPSEDQQPNQVDEMDDQSSFQLKDINLSINKGETVLIVGSNGSGKSALLYAILREMQQIGEIKVSVNGSVSFASQEPWIIQASVLENIVLDNELNVERFVKSVEMAQLYYDLEMMPAGHNTDIGEKGQTLSGGQRKRLHLARSLYLERDIYLLDNPCSALDHSTSEKLVEALRKELKNKTLIITSNSTKYWEFVDKIVYLEEGKIKFNGTYKEFEKLDQSKNYILSKSSEYDLDEIKIKCTQDTQVPEIEATQAPQLVFQNFDKKPIKLVNDEDRALGSINKEVFGSIYSLYGKKVTFIVAGVLSMIAMTSIITQQSQMTYITQASNSEEITEDERQAATTAFLLIYPVCGVIAAIFTFITSLYLAKKGAFASIRLHRKITDNLLRGSVQKFFNFVLTSVIKNRLTIDIYQFDMDTPRQLANIYSQLFSLLANLLACIALATPKAYPVLGLYIYFEIRYTIKYLQVSLQVNRLQAISKSPIVNKLSEIILGVVYLRNCSTLEIQQKQNSILLNKNQKLNICIAALDNWYIIVIQIFMFVMYVIVITLTYFDQSISKEAGTISMYLALGVGQIFLFTMINIQQFYGENINLERCLYLAKHISRDDEIQLPDPSEKNSIEMKRVQRVQPPSSNILKLNNISIKYREDLSLVMKDIELEIKENEKLAIIGRTGCGKTTLIQTITRLIEPFSGNIYMKGSDYKSYSIDTIRQHFCVVSQDPFVFEGSIKQNVDPTDLYSPQEILNQLQTYGFFNDNPELDIVETIINNMDFYIQPNGQNLSLGEKQLIVMCRTVLQRKKIVILDECTGNLDEKYGKLINLMLSLYLKDKTVIGVTHKLDQLELFDSVVLINQGQIISKGERNQIIQEYLNQVK